MGIASGKIIITDVRENNEEMELQLNNIIYMHPT